MNSDFEKDFQPIYCEKCEQQGFIFADDMNAPLFVVCSRCGWETSQVWCPKCGMGGDFINERVKDRPESWVCPDCKTEYTLPKAFYQKPIHLYLEDELPVNIRSHTAKQKPSFGKITLLGYLFISYVIFSFVMIGLVPKLGGTSFWLFCISIFSILVTLRIYVTRKNQK
jgi:hypothetical protein